MIFTPTPLPGALLVETQRHEDARGHFMRTYCEREFAAQGLPTRMVQSNASLTHHAGTLRGMHFQAAPCAEDKLVRCAHGAIWDVIIDLRPDSPAWCRWFGVELSAANGRMLFIPKGFAHGYVTLADDVLVDYQMSEFFDPDAADGVRYDDPAFGIAWPVPIVMMSDKDRAWPDYRPRSAGS